MQDSAGVWRLGIRVRDRVKLGLGGGGRGDKHKLTHKKSKISSCYKLVNKVR